MRVAYLTGRYPAVTHTFILREVRALRRLGFDVQCFSIWRTSERDLLSAEDREEWRLTQSLLPPRLWRFGRAHLSAAFAGPRAYLSLLRRAARLSMPGFRRRLVALTWFLEGVVLWDVCRQRRLRHVHAHLDGTAPMVALLAVEFGNAVSRGADGWSWSQTIHGSKEFYDVRRERLDVKVASARFIACISDYTRSQVMAFVPEELWPKVIVVRCGVDPRIFKRTCSRSKDPARLLTVGRIDAMKGTVLLLHALAELKQDGLRPQLTVVGDGPSRAKAIKLTERLGLMDQVQWIGAVGQDRIREFYEDCDIFCLPSLAEGIPIVLMEAMSMEVPVVASAITGIPELVEDGVSGLLVRPGRADELRDRLGRLLRDVAMRRAMGRAGRERVLREYDLTSNVKDLARMFSAAESSARMLPSSHHSAASVEKLASPAL